MRAAHPHQGAKLILQLHSTSLRQRGPKTQGFSYPTKMGCAPAHNRGTTQRGG